MYPVPEPVVVPQTFAERGGLSAQDWMSVFNAVQGYPIQIQMVARRYMEGNALIMGWQLTRGTHARIGVLNAALKRRECSIRIKVVAATPAKWWATSSYAFVREGA